jgi:hypothetical protein
VLCGPTSFGDDANTIVSMANDEEEEARGAPTLVPAMADSYAGGLSEGVSICSASGSMLGVIVCSTYHGIDNHGLWKSDTPA